MKKWAVCGLIGVLTASLAVAENTNNVPWYKKLFNKSADEQTQVIPPAPPAIPPVTLPSDVKAPVAEKSRPQLSPEKQAKFDKVKGQMTPEQMAKMEKMKGQMTPEQMAKIEKMKATHEELMKLGEAARNESDPVKKEALVADIRAKLTEIADKMQAEAKKRIAQASDETGKLQKKVADYENNKAARIEEQVQKILAGQPLYSPEGKRPEGGFQKKEFKKGVKAPAVQ